MDPFEVEVAIKEPKWWARWALAAFRAVLWFVGMAVFRWLTAGHWHGETDWRIYLPVLACCSLFFGLSMAFANPRRKWESRLFVDEEEITAISETVDKKKKITRGLTVRRGAVQAVFEVPPNLFTAGGFGFSGRSRRFPRMFPFIYVTHGTPKYDLIKTLALGWRAENSK